MSGAAMQSPGVGRRAWLVMALAALGACGGGDADAPPAVMTADADGVSRLDADAVATVVGTYALSALSAAEAASLALRREEEMLAQDLYTAGAARWPLPILANIAASEATHAAAVKVLLDRYRLADPMAALPDGVYPTPALQALYTRLVTASAVNLVAALQSGLELEELSIRDMNVDLRSIDNGDIVTVYENLLRASRNHLRAFWSTLLRHGGSYTPLYLSAVEFNAIVTTPIETGG